MLVSTRIGTLCRYINSDLGVHLYTGAVTCTHAGSSSQRIYGAPHRGTSGVTGSTAQIPERTPAPRARVNATPGGEQARGSSVLMRTRSGTSYRNISPAELVLDRSPVHRHHVATSTFGTEIGLIVFTRRICAHAGTSCHRMSRPLLGRNVFLLRPLLGLIVFPVTFFVAVRESFLDGVGLPGPA